MSAVRLPDDLNEAPPTSISRDELTGIVLLTRPEKGALGARLVATGGQLLPDTVDAGGKLGDACAGRIEAGAAAGAA